MKILITGAKGFLGTNLIYHLQSLGYNDLVLYDVDSDYVELEEVLINVKFVFHLAGVNRPALDSDFMEGNYEFTKKLINSLRSVHNTCPIMLSSSIQAELDNPYGKSKLAGESILVDYSNESGAPIYIFRFPNIFGKWSRPNYNSAIATFCYNISRGIPININNPETIIELVYIDDVVNHLSSLITVNENYDRMVQIKYSYKKSLSQIANYLIGFHSQRKELTIPDLDDDFIKKLYSTYLSFLPKESFCYSIRSHVDFRGSFTELFRTHKHGQFSINISNPGITKGNHWHTTKVEKFIVVYGSGVIRFRDVRFGEIIEYYVNGSDIQVIDIPPGYTHNIENLGLEPLITVMWANECYTVEKPDTFYLSV